MRLSSFLEGWEANTVQLQTQGTLTVKPGSRGPLWEGCAGGVGGGDLLPKEHPADEAGGPGGGRRPRSLRGCRQRSNFSM